jgi:hypothetical protein
VAGLNALRKRWTHPERKDFGLAEENISEGVRLILPVIPGSNPRPSPRKTSPRC